MKNRPIKIALQAGIFSALVLISPISVLASNFPVDAITVFADNDTASTGTLLASSAGAKTILYASIICNNPNKNGIVIGTTVTQPNANNIVKVQNNSSPTSLALEMQRALPTNTALTWWKTAANDDCTFSAVYVPRDISLLANSVSVLNFPASQAVTGTFWQATQPVSLASVPSHAVTVSNFPASQAVTGTFWPATQPISGTVSVDNFPTATSTINIGSTTINVASSTGYTGANFSEWLFAVCVIIFALAILVWRMWFTPIKTMYGQ